MSTEIFMWLMAGAATVIGFFLKSTLSDIKELKAALQAFQIHVPTYYVAKAELKDVLERVYSELVEIKNELRKKEDRT